jgi:tripartite-type tricarboxylate transporter receptor subunit TctC
MPRARLAILILLAAIAAVPRMAQAAAWPNRPLRMLVPFSAGSSSDSIARIVAAKMGDALGQPVMVENRVGGSTIIGTDAVARSAPDGYTLGLANTTSHAVSASLNQRLPFDPLKDFVPIGMIGRSPFVLVTSEMLPPTSLSAFVSLAKERPGSLTYASAGTGTLAHLAGELFKRRADVDVVHVSYRGTEQSLLDLMQGRIDLSVSTIGPTLQQIRSGKIKALAVMAAHRNAMIPDVQTVAEGGVPGCEAELWTALVVPAGVPAEIAKRLNDALNLAVNDTAVQDALKIQGIEPEPGPPEAVTAAIKSDIAKWRNVVETAKIGQQK